MCFPCFPEYEANSRYIRKQEKSLQMDLNCPGAVVGGWEVFPKHRLNRFAKDTQDSVIELRRFLKFGTFRQ